ncbi:MAG: penicillin-binding protein activator LpoB, partial [Thermodesulfovibrionia bacterium]|nr:penicillin-binding protein activator LpoB [Thermodesulfovibrionia bacterium]
GLYVMAGGKSQGIKKDDVFGVYKRGKKVKNPQTGMFIELSGQLIGKIKVQQLSGNNPSNEISLCTVLSGNIPVSNFSELYIQELD